MILYFDNYITNTPLIPNFYTELDKIRMSCKAYSTRDKFNITLYTLASYAEYPWTKAIIVYSLEDESRKKEFEKKVRSLFPKKRLILIHGRSDTQKKYQEKLELINKIEDDWIYYAGNNDHPFICPNFDILNECLKKAEEYAKKHKFVSIFPTNFWEGYNIGRKGTALHDIQYPYVKTLFEDDLTIVCLFKGKYPQSQIIFNKRLLNHILTSAPLNKKEVYRKIEEMAPEIKWSPQIVIYPKKIICDHFDGYSYNKFTGFPVPSEIVPPLFIPQGFFERKIKIRYGYDDYKEGWVNINPLKEKYSFQEKGGADLKIGIEDIPLFWKERISKIDINPNMDKKAIKKAVIKNNKLMSLPFMDSSKKGYFSHILKHKLKRSIYDSKIMVPIFKLYKKNSILKKIHRIINGKIFS